MHVGVGVVSGVEVESSKHSLIVWKPGLYTIVLPLRSLPKYINLLQLQLDKLTDPIISSPKYTIEDLCKEMVDNDLKLAKMKKNNLSN